MELSLADLGEIPAVPLLSSLGCCSSTHDSTADTLPLCLHLHIMVWPVVRWDLKQSKVPAWIQCFGKIPSANAISPSTFSSADHNGFYGEEIGVFSRLQPFTLHNLLLHRSFTNIALLLHVSFQLTCARARERASPFPSATGTKGAIGAQFHQPMSMLQKPRSAGRYTRIAVMTCLAL